MKKYMFMIFMILMTGVFATTIYIPEDYATIQEGIDASEDGDEIIVSPGAYVENINFLGKAIILGSLFYTTQDTSYISQTIIDGNQDGSVVTFESGEDSTSVLTGFTITNGLAESGGGIHCDHSSPILENLTISDNSVEDYIGGGIYCTGSSPILDHVTITNNSAGCFGVGGGFCCTDSSSPSLENTIISNNLAGGGGGINCNDSSLNLKNVIIIENPVSFDGGGISCNSSILYLENVMIIDHPYGSGIDCSSSNLSLENVIIAGNSAYQFGGGIVSYRSSLNLVNVTLTANSAEVGGGIYCSSNSSPILVNCIFWNNSPQEVEFASDWDSNTITVAYSDIAGGEEGLVTNNNGTVDWLECNIDADPLFEDALMGDFHLTESSPCIDAGIGYFEYEGEILVDLSEDEYFGVAPDMGAFESPFTSIVTDKIEPIKECISIYPNPFNPETNILFELSAGSNVLLEIYNIKGQKVTTLVNEPFEAGSHKVTWNATDQSSGIYLLRFNTAEKSEMKKLILLK